VESLFQMVPELVDVNATANYGLTALYLAAREGYADIVKILLKAPEIEVNCQNSEGCTPLFVAAKEDRQEIVELLMADERTDPNIQNAEGCSPLLVACEYGHLAIIHHLLKDRRVNMNLQTNSGASALFMICESGNTRIAKMLLASGRCDINLANAEKTSPLIATVHGDHVTIAHMLLQDPGLFVNDQNSLGMTAFYVACACGRLTIAQMLFKDERVDITKPTRTGATPLLAACEYGHHKIVELLLQPEVSLASFPESRISQRVSPGQSGCSGESLTLELADVIAGIENFETGISGPIGLLQEEDLKENLNLGLSSKLVDVNRPDDKGVTPLWIAARNGHVAAVKLLLAYGQGIDPFAYSIEGNMDWNEKSPRDIALLHDRKEIVELLEAFEKFPEKIGAELKRQIEYGGNLSGGSICLIF